MSKLYLETNRNSTIQIINYSYASYAHENNDEIDVKNWIYLILPKGAKFKGPGKLGLNKTYCTSNQLYAKFLVVYNLL